MDPLFVALGLGLVVLFFLTRGSPRSRGPQTIRLGTAVACRLSPEEQRKRATQRNLVYQQIEEEARNRGETGPELFGRRVAAINSLPQTLRREMGSYDPPA